MSSCLGNARNQRYLPGRQRAAEREGGSGQVVRVGYAVAEHLNYDQPYI